MSIQKKYLKNKKMFKVTFIILANQAHSAENAHVVGEFNEWSTTATPMKRMKNGSFSVTLELEAGRSYQFRYLLGQSRWDNDPDADRTVPTPYEGSYNSVLNL